MIPGPRPSEGHASPSSDGDRAQPSIPVTLSRSPRGWVVHSPAGAEDCAGGA